MKAVNQKNIIVLLAILLVVSIVGNVILYNSHRDAENQYLEGKGKPVFELLSPSIAWMNTEEFLKIQKHYSIDYFALKERILNVLNNSSTKGHYGVYFEDLNTGAWIGINEKEEFVPASLLKLPIMVAALKKVQDGELILEKKITLAKEDIDLQSGTLGLKGAGYQITIKELLTYLVKESDNTATLTLGRQVLTAGECANALVAMGLALKPYSGDYVTVTPKQYSNILRSLYYSTYLRRIFSELCLSIMSNTDYNKALPTGIPSSIRISHKYGMYSLLGQSGYNDCGIVYYPNKPYILCVMSKGLTQNEAEKTIHEISEVIYKYVDENQKGHNKPL